MKSKLIYTTPRLIFVFSISALIGGCQNEQQQLKPEIDLELGYLGSLNQVEWAFTAFPNQRQISVEKLKACTQTSITPGLMISLTERNIKCSSVNIHHPGSISGYFDSLVFQFQIATSVDEELFVSNKNGWKSGGGGGADCGNINCVIDINYLIPVKFVNGNSRGTNYNNDTLEINPVDTIKINYHSLYTSQSIKSNFKVTNR